MKTKALALLLYCFYALFTPNGQGADLPERKGVQDIKKTLQIIVESEAGSQQLSDAIKILQRQFARLQEDSRIEVGGPKRFMFRALPIRQCTQEEKDDINQSLFRALPKIIGEHNGEVNPEAYMLLISVQADCPAPETKVWTKWLASKAGYWDVLWTWPPAQFKNL